METMFAGKEQVVVTDIKMPFWSMVVFIIKWTFAAIPAMIILSAVGAIVFAIFSTFIAALLHNLGSVAR
jgi:hypothetical protein